MRYSVRRLVDLAGTITRTAQSLGFHAPLAFPPPPKPVDVASKYLDLVKDEDLRDATQKLYVDGHYAQAVEEAYKCLNSYIKKRSGSDHLDGADLMRTVFSPKKPKLKLNRLQSTSQISEQLGYMDIYAGCMTGIRNPRAHEHRLKDTADQALELLAWADHLITRAKLATRARSPRKKSN